MSDLAENRSCARYLRASFYHGEVRYHVLRALYQCEGLDQQTLSRARAYRNEIRMNEVRPSLSWVMNRVQNLEWQAFECARNLRTTYPPNEVLIPLENAIDWCLSLFIKK